MINGQMDNATSALPTPRQASIHDEDTTIRSCSGIAGFRKHCEVAIANGERRYESTGFPFEDTRVYGQVVYEGRWIAGCTT